MRTCAFLLALATPWAAYAAESPPWATKDLRAGIIGTDTSHVPAFTELFRSHPEWKIRVTTAFKAGSPDLPTSANRVEGFAKTIHDKCGVELVGSIAELLPKVDVVLLESVDGRPHLSQATPVLKAGKPLFIDKPLAASLDDVRRIVALANETGTPFFSASSLRFHPDIPRLLKNPGVGKVAKVQGSSSLNKLEFHPDLFFYGIHGVEPLYAVMGTGCVSVSRKIEGGVDITTGKWKDGRVGVYYGVLSKEKMPIIRVWGTGGTTDSVGQDDYKGLVGAIAEFFQTGKAPVDPAETIELFEFMTAAQLSKERGGAEVPLQELRR
ncbi:MAG: Gfo/Idh/MocA family protein [Thermoguttaceae bacterium]